MILDKQVRFERQVVGVGVLVFVSLLGLAATFFAAFQILHKLF